MDVFEIRHRNLLYLIEQLAARSPRQKDIAQALGGFSAAHFSQLKAGARMGEQVARKIEQAIGMETGWMDRPQWPPAVVKDDPEISYINQSVDKNYLLPDEQRIIDLYRRASPTAKAMLMAAAEAAVTAS